MTLCVYALVLGTPDPLPRALRSISVGSITAVVRSVARKPDPTDSALRAHDRQIRLLAQETSALLPVRFGTCFDDAEELKSVLDARQASLRKALRHVRGRAQMTLRIATTSSPEAQSPKPEAPTGAAYLRARAAARTVPEFAPLRAAVRRWVKDERVEKHGALASVYQLIPRGSVDAYRRAITRAAADTGVRLLVTGPHPPYAFATTFAAP